MFHALCTQFHGDTYEQALDTVFALKVNGARQDLLFVFKDCFNHFHRGGGGSVVGRAGLEQGDDFGAAFSSAVEDGFEFFFRKQFREGNPGHCRILSQRHHIVAVASENEGVDVFDRDVELGGDEGAHAGGVEHAGHAEDAILREAADAEGGLRHGVQWIGDDDQDGIGREPGEGLDDGFHHVVVGLQQVVAAHAGFAGDSGSDDDHIAIGGGAVVAVLGRDAGGTRVGAENRARLGHVERFARGHVLDEIGDDDIGETGVMYSLSCRRADKTAAYNRDLPAHSRIS